MGVDDPWGMASLDPRGMVGRIFVYILNLLTLGLIFSEKRIFEGYLAIYKHMTPWGVVSFNPRGLIVMIYVGND